MRRVSSNRLLAGSAGLLVIVLLFAAISIPGWTAGAPSSSPADDGEQTSPGEPSTKFPVTIRRPSGPPVVELSEPDSSGRVGRVACSTCHSIREPKLASRTSSDLQQFHQDLPIAHGNLACYACHNPDDSDTLQRADGSVVQYTDVMTLCAQCHGAQASNYARGFHGGMTGYWDLNRGPRVRNNCIDCHDPHVPKFPMMQPTFNTRDRFLTPPKHSELLPHDESNH